MIRWAGGPRDVLHAWGSGITLCGLRGSPTLAFASRQCLACHRSLATPPARQRRLAENARRRVTDAAVARMERAVEAVLGGTP